MFSRWIIFVVLLKFAENLPTETRTLEEHDSTYIFNKMFDILQPSNWNGEFISKDYCLKDCKDVWFQNGLHFSNVSVNFYINQTLCGKLHATFQENITLTCEMLVMSFKGHVMNTDHYIETEPIPLNITALVSLSQAGNGKNFDKYISIDSPNLDLYNIKLKTNGYQYKPNEEDQIKQDFKTFMKAVAKETRIVELGILITFAHDFANFLVAREQKDFKEQMDYYFIGKIPTTDYTLSNVKIKQLWNFRSYLKDKSNPEDFPKIEIRDVSGTMIQNFRSTVKKPVNLSFKVDRIFVSGNHASPRVNIVAGGYSVTNTESQTLFADDQSKLIVHKIMSAVADQIKASWRPRNVQFR